MQKGNIICCGSAQFLKKSFQTGYLLKVGLNSNCNRNALLEQIQNYVQDASVYMEKDFEIDFRLVNLNSVDKTSLNTKLENLFKWLENNSKDFGVENWSLSN